MDEATRLILANQMAIMSALSEIMQPEFGQVIGRVTVLRDQWTATQTVLERDP